MSIKEMFWRVIVAILLFVFFATPVVVFVLSITIMNEAIHSF